MRSSIFTPFLGLAASVSAITITYPNITDVNGTPRIDLSVPQTITWDSVPSDPTTFNITLVRAPDGSSTVPSQIIPIDSKVTTSDDKYVMQPPSGAVVNGTYQIFFNAPYNSTTVGVIAESHDFIASKVSGASTTTKSSAPTPTSVATTVTPTHSSAAVSLKAFGGAGVMAGLAMLCL